MLVIHLAGKEVYVIYIYVFFFYLPSSLYFLSEEVYLFKAILKANDQQDRGLFSHLVVIQCKLRSLSWSVVPLHPTHPLLTLLFFSFNPCLALSPCWLIRKRNGIKFIVFLKFCLHQWVTVWVKLAVMLFYIYKV